VADGPVADLTVGPPPAPQVADSAGIAGGKQSGKTPPGTPRAGRIGHPSSLERGVATDPDGVPAVIDEALVRRVLRSAGGAANAVIGDEDVPDHWRFTTDELDELVPPLTKFINRTPQLVVAMQHGDELAMLQTLSGYGFRNYMAGRTAQESRREREREAEGSRAGGDLRLGGPLPGDGHQRPDAVGDVQR
jgi:hypothetical protein